MEEAWARYTADIKDPAMMSDEFVDAFYHLLASAMAMPLVDSASMQQTMQLVESTVGENDVLYTGDLTAGLALGGYNTEGRVYIEHGTPYPFHLSAIIRKVSMHG